MTTTWGMPDERTLPSGPLATVAAVAGLGGVVVGFVLAVVTSPVIGVVGGICFIALVVVWTRSQGRVALRRYRARSAHPDRHARFINLVEGLAPLMDGGSPTVMVLESKLCNALVTRAGGKPTVAVTSLLLDVLARTELEAVVAHGLVRSGLDPTLHASAACSLGRLSGSLAPPVGYDDDVRAVALTRYPPALAKALNKMDPAGPRFGPMWIVARDSHHRPVEERIAALGDL